MEPETFVFSLTAIIVLGVLAKWVGWATRIPSILILLLTGLIIGPILGLVHTKELFGDLLIPVVSLSVGVILFEGGLTLRFRDLKDFGHVIILLVTVGAATGFFLSTLFLVYVLHFSWTFSLLESAILIVTGPTVIIPLLEHLNVKEPANSILKWEGIVIDPIGAILAVLVFDSLIQKTTESAVEVMVFGAVETLLVGSIVGVAVAYLILLILRRFLLPDALQNPVVLMFLIGAFTTANAFKEDAGLISVTIMGLILANQAQTQVQHIADFKENLKIILIGFLFITLSSAINLATLLDTLPESLALLVFLIFIGRPATVLVSTIFSNLGWKDILFMSFMAPRGIIAAAISALFGLVLAGIDYEEAHVFAPMTFTIITGTVIFYSIVTPLLADYLKISSIPNQGVLIIGCNRVARAIGDALFKERIDVRMIDTDYWKVSETKQYEMPVYHGPFITYETANPEGFIGLGKLLALTERDDINSLAVRHFNPHFDIADSYQLQTRTDKIPESAKGRVLFGKEYTFDKLDELMTEGYVVKTTNLNPEFTYKKLKETYKSRLIPLFFIRKTGHLVPITDINPCPPKAEGKIIFLCLK